MSNRTTGYRVAARDAAKTVPTNDGKRFAALLTRGELELEYYAPRGSDPQSPHARDELYFVVSGSGDFVCGDGRTAFAPGDALFAPAGVTHRFEDFSDDFATWVVFYGPDGGEQVDTFGGIQSVLTALD